MNDEKEMYDLRKSIEKFLFEFDRLVEMFGFSKSITNLKKSYSDICSRGDVIINELISGLEDDNNDFYTLFMKKNKDNAAEIKMLIDDHLLDTIDFFMCNSYSE